MSLNHETPVTVLVVDDDPDCRLLIRDAIAACAVGHVVFECANGIEALSFLNRDGANADAPRPALIYLDLEMPQLDGQATLSRIKSDPSLRDIPVVMMTGVSDDARIKLAADAGANSYTIKPASAEQFLKTVVTSTNYWLTVHQSPDRHLPAEACRR